MAMIGTDGRFRLVNAALCKLLGRTEAELLQRTLAKTIHPEEWSVRKRLFERMLTGEIRTHQTQGRVVTGQGEARWMLVNATALTDGDGWPTEFFVQFQDITEQARGQQLLGARHDVTRVLAQRHASRRRRRCCSRRSAPTSAGRSARCGWPTRIRASWRRSRAGATGRTTATSGESASSRSRTCRCA
jgi:PAS domain S-box-containing protein